MTENMPQATRSFSWKAALLGGSAAIASSMFVGGVRANLALSTCTGEGKSIDACFGSLQTNVQMAITLAVAAACSLLGGAAAGSLVGHKAALHGLAAGVVSAAFIAVMHLSPMSFPVPAWFGSAMLVIPVVFSPLGAQLFRKNA